MNENEMQWRLSPKLRFLLETDIGNLSRSAWPLSLASPETRKVGPEAYFGVDRYVSTLEERQEAYCCCYLTALG